MSHDISVTGLEAWTYLTIRDEEQLIRSVWERWEHWLRTCLCHHTIGLVGGIILIIIIICQGLTKIIIIEEGTSNVCMWFYTRGTYNNNIAKL